MASLIIPSEAVVVRAPEQHPNRMAGRLGKNQAALQLEQIRESEPHRLMPGGLGGLLGGLLGGGGSGKEVSGGLGELIDSFTGSGHGEVADSWVKTGPNKEVDEPELADALGSDTLDQLATQTGLSREELLSRLKSILPTAIDKLTPQGRLPT